jgi:hypothetical protein
MPFRKEIQRLLRLINHLSAIQKSIVIKNSQNDIEHIVLVTKEYWIRKV